MFKNLRKKKKGFTLIELIIVVAILAILAAVAIPRLGSMTGKAQESADIASAKTIANAATIVIAEGTEPTGKYENIEVKTLSTTDPADAFMTKLVGNLQSVPKSKSNASSFFITVEDDSITITAGSNGKKFFPQ